jgi:hypothetical protein
LTSDDVFYGDALPVQVRGRQDLRSTSLRRRRTSVRSLAAPVLEEDAGDGVEGGAGE